MCACVLLVHPCPVGGRAQLAGECVLMYVCMPRCVFVCVCVRGAVSAGKFVLMHVCACMYVSIDVCMEVRMHKCDACLVCMYVGMYVQNVCMCVYMHVLIDTSATTSGCTYASQNTWHFHFIYVYICHIFTSYT
jgi:hypothetical protein